MRSNWFLGDRGSPVHSQLRQIADYLLAQENAAAVNPSSIGTDLLPHLFVLDVERDPAKPGVQLRIRLVGTAIDQIFRRPLKGRFLEEFIHGPRAKQVVEAFHHCAETHEPLWLRQVVHLKDRLPRFVEGVVVYLDPERLYGGLIVGDATLQSAHGSFDRAGISRGS
jgi:hypothetical protein